MNFPDDLQMIPCLLNYHIPQFARMQSAKLLTSESAGGRLTDYLLVTQRINHEIRKITTTKDLLLGLSTARFTGYHPGNKSGCIFPLCRLRSRYGLIHTTNLSYENILNVTKVTDLTYNDRRQKDTEHPWPLTKKI